MNKAILVTGAILGITGIILGAFGAHGLKELISTESIKTFETGVSYQIYHAFFLLVVGITDVIPIKFKRIIYYLTPVGILLFSGSIYLLATNELSNYDFKTIGFITPLGGLSLIVAWFVLLISILKLKTDKSQK